jgi:exonuclease I
MFVIDEFDEMTFSLGYNSARFYAEMHRDGVFFFFSNIIPVDTDVWDYI